MPNEWASKVGQALRQLRPGMGALATAKLRNLATGMVLTSAAFADGAAIPARYTQDGERVFPPLAWTGVPATAGSLALIVEDADAPFPRPLVHAILHCIPTKLAGLPEGALPVKLIGRSPLGFAAGRNSFARTGFLAPSPLPGHGPHRYAFQLLALTEEPRFKSPPGRGALMRGVRKRVIAVARLVGVYQRA